DQGHGQFDVPRIWAPEAFKREIGALVKGYFPIHEALKKDDLARATAASGKFFTQLASIKHHDPVWDTFRTIMGTFAGTLRVAKSIGEARDAFFSLARAMILTVKSYGVSVEGSVYLHYCPMARKNRGGWWLAPKKEIENPFFGAGMFSCGENLGLLHGPTPQKAKGGADAK
ncbi:DUF3347 domain-containing protein, partial [Myxococcota bacterium]|nr:DUF3347 domain-containing protein [Myxococcota bacterium]MBU1537835.1 DUF3347 domain-containing protein [Myxococcota bacterium]